MSISGGRVGHCNALIHKSFISLLVKSYIDKMEIFKIKTSMDMKYVTLNLSYIRHTVISSTIRSLLLKLHAK